MPNKKFQCEHCGVCCVAAPCLLGLAEIQEVLLKLQPGSYQLHIEHEPSDIGARETIIMAQVTTIVPYCCAFMVNDGKGWFCAIFDQLDNDKFEDGCELPRIRKLIKGNG